MLKPRSESKFRTPAFWKASSSTTPVKTREIIEDVFHITGETFPGNWEMQAVFEDGHMHPVIMIRFPEVNIHNRSKEHMVLKDLFVFFVIKPYASGFSIPQLYGNRGTFTANEYASKYMHSHLGSFTINDNNRRGGSNTSSNKQITSRAFCLGTGGINNLMNGFANGWDATTYQMFLFSIIQFVEYESLEGGPYIKMKNIISKNTIKNFHREIGAAYSIVERMYEAATSNSFNIKYVKNRYIVVDDSTLNKFLLACVSSNNQVVVLDENGNYYRNDDATVNEAEIKNLNTDIEFNDAPIKVKLLEANQTVKRVQMIHPFIKRVFINYVESIIEKNIINVKFKIQG